MTAAVMDLPMVPDYIGLLEERILRELSGMVHDWSKVIGPISRWEDEHLADPPHPALLATHKAGIERLIRMGRMLELSTTQEAFPDKALAETVAATQRCLRDKLILWHSQPVSTERADEILRGAGLLA